MTDKERCEERYKRTPVFEWRWPHWLATVAVMAILGAAFLAAVFALTGDENLTLRMLGYSLALSGFPLACVLLWWWYRALQAEEETVIVEPVQAQEPVVVVEEREPVLYQPYAPKQLEAANALTPDVLVLIIKELWERGKLSRRAVTGLRLPGGQTVSRRMWERLVGGYRDAQGREKPGLLAEAGLVVRSNDRSWTWREGLTLEDALACFDWGIPQIEAPRTSEDVGRAGRAGRGAGITHAERRRKLWQEVGCDARAYLERKLSDGS